MKEMLGPIWIGTGIIIWLAIFVFSKKKHDQDLGPIGSLILCLVLGPLMLIGSMIIALASQSKQPKPKSKKKLKPKLAETIVSPKVEREPPPPSPELLEKLAELSVKFSNDYSEPLTSDDYAELQRTNFMVRREMQSVTEYIPLVRNIVQHALKHIDQVNKKNDKVKQERITLLKDTLSSLPKSTKGSSDLSSVPKLARPPIVDKPKAKSEPKLEHQSMPELNSKAEPKHRPESIAKPQSKSRSKPEPKPNVSENSSAEIKITPSNKSKTTSISANKSASSATVGDTVKPQKQVGPTNQVIVNAALKKDWEQVLKLLNTGISPNQRFKLPEQDLSVHLLIYASAYAPLALIKVMLEKGADVNAEIDDCTREDTTLFSPLIAAAYRDFTALEEKQEIGERIMMLLLDSGAAIEPYKDCESVYTPFIAAAYNYRFKVIDRLIKEGVDVNIGNTKGENAYFIVASYEEELHRNKNRMLRLLRDAGVEMERFNHSGIHALHHAVINQHGKLVEFHIMDSEISVLSPIAENASFTQGRNAYEMCFFLKELPRVYEESVTDRIVSRVFYSVENISIQSPDYDPSLLVWAMHLRMLGGSPIDNKNKFKTQVRRILERSPFDTIEINDQFISGDINVVLYLEQFIYLMALIIERNIDDLWLSELVDVMFKKKWEVFHGLKERAHGQRVDLTEYFPSYSDKDNLEDLKQKLQLLHNKLPKTSEALQKVFNSYSVNVSKLRDEVSQTNNESSNEDLIIYKPTTKFVNLVCSFADKSKDEKELLKNIKSYLKNRRNKIIANDFFAIVDALAETDAKSTKKIVKALGLVIDDLSRRLEGDYEYEFAGYRRHFLHLFNDRRAALSFNLNYAKQAVDNCKKHNPKALELLQIEFGLYDFPALDLPLTGLHYQAGHDYAVYMELITHKAQIIDLLSTVLMNFYDTVDELCWMLNNALVLHSAPDNKENMYLFKNIDMPYLGHVLGYIPEHLVHKFSSHENFKNYRIFKSFDESIEVECVKYKLTSAIMRFLIQHWEEIIAARLQYEVGVDDSWLDNFRNFILVMNGVGWPILTKLHLQDDSGTVLSNLAFRSAVLNDEGKWRLDFESKVKMAIVALRKMFKDVLANYKVDIIGLTSDIMVPDGLSKLRQHQVVSRKFFIEYQILAAQAVKLSPKKALDHLAKSQIAETISRIADYCEIPITIETKGRGFSLTVESKWERYYPKVRYKYDAINQFIQATHEADDIYLVNCYEAVEHNGFVHTFEQIDDNLFVDADAEREDQDEFSKYILSPECEFIESATFNHQGEEQEEYDDEDEDYDEDEYSR